MVAKRIQSLFDDVGLSNYVIPEWNINFPTVSQVGAREVDLRQREHEINFQRITYLFQSDLVDRLNLYGHYQRIENFLPRSDASRLFQADEGLGIGFGSQFLVCPIRGGEILDARHSGYTLLPINFYDEIFKKMQLTPVFMGQTDSNIYTDALRRRFPEALFVKHQGIIADFQTIRKSKNIMLSVSTFAWLAAWLSDAQNIILPVFGIFNPQQHPEVDLLPLGDDRYKFYQFPAHKAVPVNEVAEDHKLLEGRWHRVDPINLFTTLRL